MSEQFDRIQQSVLSLLIFNSTHCHLIRNCLDLKVWDGPNRPLYFLAQALYNFMDTHKVCAGATHVYEIIFSLPIAKSDVNLLLEYVTSLEDHIEEINIEFTLTRLESFYRSVTIRNTVPEILKLTEREELDKVEELLHGLLKRRLNMFDRGTTLLEALSRRILSDKASLERDLIYLGIPALDLRKLVPTRKKMMVLGGGPKTGKSFFLVHVTKRALIEGKRVAYVTLELSEDTVSERIIQSVYAVTKRQATELDRLIVTPNGFGREMAPKLKCLYDDENIVALEVADKLRRDKFINNRLFVKEFPMDSLTFPQLNAFLDNLEMQENFSPDVLVVDYGKLMYKSEKTDYRISIGKIYENLRKLASERNIAVVTAIQLNRSAAKSKKADDEHIAECYDVVATADVFLTYNQTELEHELKLARLYVSQARDEEGGFEIYITQDYNCAQFVQTSQEASAGWKDRYDGLIQSMMPKEDKK